MGYTLVQRPQGNIAPQAAPQKRFRLVSMPQVVNSGAKRDRELSTGEYAEDVAKSFGVGAAKGAIGLAGLPGDVKQGLTGAAEWAATNLGASPEMAQQIARAVQGGLIAIPGMGPQSMGSAQITDVVRDATRPAPNISQLVTGEQPQSFIDRKPRTVAGEYGQTLGEFAPAAVAGPGGVVRKFAMAAVPALASETAGQITKGTDMEGPARTAAGLIGGIAAAGRGGNVMKFAAEGAPDREAVKAATDALYGRLRSAGIKYDSNSYDLMARNLAVKMKNEGFRPKNSAKVTDSLEYVLEGMGKSPDYSDFEALRKNAGELLVSQDKSERKFGSMIVGALDDFAERSPLVTSGNVPSSQVASLMKEARAMAQRNIKARTVEDAVEAARNTASGFENGLRIEFRKILNNPKRRAGFNTTELEAMKEIVRGTSAQNLAAQFGRLGIGFGTKTAKAAALPVIAGGAGWLASEPIIGGSAVAVASGVKYAAAKNAEKIADRMTKTVLAGKDAQRAALQAKRGEQLKVQLRRLLALDNAARQTAASPAYAVQEQNGGNR